MRVVAIIQARMGSTRLPGKVLKNLAGKCVLEHVVERVKLVRSVDEVIVATSNKRADGVIEELCLRNGVACFRGSEEDVLGRFYHAAVQFGAEIIVRVTADCPLIDFQTVDLLVAQLRREHLDYISVEVEKIPLGLPSEVFTFAALKRAYFEARNTYDKEHVTSYIYANEEHFVCRRIAPEKRLQRPDLRLTLDTAEDLLLLEEIYSRLHQQGKPVDIFSVIDLLDAEPRLKSINAIPQKSHRGRHGSFWQHG